MTITTLPQTGHQIITPDHPAWIHGLEYIVWPEGSGVWADGQPKLWVRGRAELLQEATWNSAVAVTGSRAATSYGLHVAGELGYDLAPRVSAVVATSGFGIDAAALRGSMTNDEGLTVAVSSCGIDRVYPVAHSALLDQVANHGVVVSLFGPGVTVRRERFIATRVLLAAMCKAMVVVEAGRRGGALSAAHLARQAGKPVFAVPGPITSAASAGTLDLIKDGHAKVCTGAADVLEVVGG